MSGNVPPKLRSFLWNWDSNLYQVADTLWKNSEAIHHRQNRQGDPNECGRVHVERVEYNIWRLLFDEQNPAKLFIRNQNEFKDKPYEIFLLSAAACCHDFDKAIELPEGFIHGEGSAEIVRLNKDKLGLDDDQVAGIKAVISIHGIDNAQEFKDKQQALSTREPYTLRSFNLQRLALFLKAADILHLDRSRISSDIENIIDSKKLTNRQKKKLFFRSHINCWIIKDNAIHLEASVNRDDVKLQKKLKKSFEWIKKNEWSAVTEYLKTCGFAYKLELDFKDECGNKIDSSSQQSDTDRKFIHINAKRFIQEQHTRHILYTALEQDDEQYLCRNGYATHAAASAVGCVWVLVMLEKMQHFKKIFVTDVNEFVLEIECSLQKLCEHITRFSNTQALFIQLIYEISMKDAICSFPEGEHLFNKLDSFRRALAAHLKDMRQRVMPKIAKIDKSDIPNDKKEQALELADWLENADPDVWSWFKRKKRDFTALANDLEAPIESLLSMRYWLQDDWNKDAVWIQKQEKGMHSPFAGK